MSFDEKNAWVYAFVALGSYLLYLAVILLRAREAPLPEVAYVGPMLWAIGGSVAASVAGTIVITVGAPKDADKRDERDAVINRYGDVVGFWVLSVGVVGALASTMAQLAHFWIGNAIYLAFVLSALASTTVKLLAYRRGFQPW